MPARTITSPVRTKRRPCQVSLSRACTQAPAVQPSVAPVTAMPATSGLRWRTAVIARVTYASAPKNANVSRPRLRIVAGSPGRAVRVPAGTSRRSEGSPAATPATISAAPAAAAPAAARARTGNEREAGQDHRGAGRHDDAVDQLVLLHRAGAGRAEPGQGRHRDRPGHRDHRQQAQEHPPPPEHVRHLGGHHRPGQPRHDPRGGQDRHHAGLQRAGEAAADRGVGHRRDRARAQSLQHAARDQHRHRGGQAGDGQPRPEQHQPGHERDRGPAPVGLPAGRHDADHAAQHERAEHPAVQAQAAKILGDERHHRHHRQRLRRDEGDRQDQADGQPPGRRRPEPPDPALAHPPLHGATRAKRAYLSCGMTSAARRSACSAWSNIAVNRISSAPASTTLRSSRTQSAGVPVTAAASMSSDRCP